MPFSTHVHSLQCGSDCSPSVAMVPQGLHLSTRKKGNWVLDSHTGYTPSLWLATRVNSIGNKYLIVSLLLCPCCMQFHFDVRGEQRVASGRYISITSLPRLEATLKEPRGKPKQTPSGVKISNIHLVSCGRFN